MRRWAADMTDQGPISLGSRLGHLQSDSRVFRALVYNKSAVVLHMLRQLIGDEAFFNGLRRFYHASRYRSVGTAEFRAAIEIEAGRPLGRFFERWIYGTTLPRLTFSYEVKPAEVVLRIEQTGEIFDLPVVITLRYADGSSADVIVPVTDSVAQVSVPLAGTLRGAEISREEPPLAVIVRN
jgi:aminopeptidase N